MSNEGILTVISGFSGAGKSQLTKLLMSEHENYAFSVSATTRGPRTGEVDGKDYFFISKEQFEEMIQNGELLEYNCYVNNYYGTPRNYVLKMLSEGKDVILEIDVNGARNIKKAFPEACTVFVTAPSAKVLETRLTGRGTESADVVRSRLTQALTEADCVADYDYLLVNDDLKETVDLLHSLIQNEKMKTCHMTGYMDCFKKDMKEILSL